MKTETATSNNELFPQPEEDHVWSKFWDALTKDQQDILGYLAISANGVTDSGSEDCNGIISDEENWAVDKLQDIVGGQFALSMMLIQGYNAEFWGSKLDRQRLEYTIWGSLEAFFPDIPRNLCGPWSFAREENYRLFAQWSGIIDDYITNVEFNNRDHETLRNAINFFKAQLWDAAIADF